MSTEPTEPTPDVEPSSEGNEAVIASDAPASSADVPPPLVPESPEAPEAPALAAIDPTASHRLATPSILEVRGLTKTYGTVSALSGLDLTVRQGEVYGFLGRNGAGKSTTIRILMGITQKTAGEVRLFGEASTDLVKARQRIGYVAQEQTFYGWMSPRALASFLRGFYPTWDDEEFKRLARLLEVPTDRGIGTFSGGMRVKVALAAALAHRPPLLLLDEPTAGLDPVARREFLEIVRDEARRSGRTTFFSSHLVDEVELVAHRVGIVDGGRTRYEGTIRELAARVRLLSQPISEHVQLPMLTSQLTARGLRVLHHDEHEGLLRLYVEAKTESAFTDLPHTELPFRVEPLSLEEIFVAMVRRKVV